MNKLVFLHILQEIFRYNGCSEIVQLNISLDEIAYVGDNYNDIGAFKIVGLAIAFNSEEEEVKKFAKVIIDKKDLREILNHI